MAKLFNTGGLSPLEPGYQESVADQGGRASDWLRPTKGGGEFPPRRAQTYSEEKSVRIKREYPIDVFANMHLQGGRRRGRSAMYVCPWHNDSASSPNLEVPMPGHARYGSCKCWRCGEGGSVVDLAMAVFGTDSPGDAMNLIEGRSPIDEARRREYAERSRRYEEAAARKPACVNPQEGVIAFLNAAWRNLQEDDAATRYLLGRGLGPAISRFKLGSSTGIPDDLLPRGWDAERGVTYPARAFRDRIVIPYLVPGRKPRYFNARAFLDKDAGRKGYKYRKPADVTPEPYLLDLALRQDNVLMCEGEIDALSVWTALKDEDRIGAFAVPGLHCFTEDDAVRLAGKRVFIVTDNDAAGREARSRLGDLALGYARSAHHLSVEHGFSDLNDMLVARGRDFTRGWLKACVQRAVRPAKRLI